jgi:hypothetical protein
MSIHRIRENIGESGVREWYRQRIWEPQSWLGSEQTKFKREKTTIENFLPRADAGSRVHTSMLENANDVSNEIDK